MDNLFTAAQLDYLTNYFKGKFVLQADCDTRHEKSDKELEEIKLQLAKAITLLNIVVKVLAFVAAGMGTLILGAIGALIFIK